MCMLNPNWIENCLRLAARASDRLTHDDGAGVVARVEQVGALLPAVLERVVHVDGADAHQTVRWPRLARGAAAQVHVVIHGHEVSVAARHAQPTRIGPSKTNERTNEWTNEWMNV